VAVIRTTDPAEAAALLAAGAHLVRRVHDMELELSSKRIPGRWLRPSLRATLRLTAVDRPAVALAAASVGAYESGHVDAAWAPSLQEATANYDRLLAGDTAGPLLHSLSLLHIVTRSSQTD
jgi:hypothetical protein